MSQRWDDKAVEAYNPMRQAQEEAHQRWRDAFMESERARRPIRRDAVAPVELLAELCVEDPEAFEIEWNKMTRSNQP